MFCAEFIPCRVAEDGKGAGTNSGKSGTKKLETESIRSRAESTGGCVKLKTVTEVRRSSARNTFIAGSCCFFFFFFSEFSRELIVVLIDCVTRLSLRVLE